ncbi:MAG: HAD-IC family P-type ATPase, partial [Clostridia bacterium]
DMLFIVVIVLNTLIAIIQECKAKHTVSKLALVSSPKVKVVRNGEELLVKSTELVLDDIIEISIGNQIPADLIMLSGYCEVNESLLTGESVAIKKHENDELLAGSFITSGKCCARVNKIGKDIYIQTIAKEARRFQKPSSNLFKDLSRLIKIIGAFIVPIGIAMFINNFYGQHAPLPLAITKTCGSLIGMIPAGMFLLVTIALALGVVKLAKHKTLVQDLYSIEMLARTNILCLDKTGTLTDGTMEVENLIVLNKSDKTDYANILANISYCQQTENQTSRALISKFGKASDLVSKLNLPFSSDRKQTITAFENVGTFALGAPEYINTSLTKSLKLKIKNLSKKGLRVLLLASNKNDNFKENGPDKFDAVALVAISDHIREDAPKTIEWFKSNGVAIKIISGDNPETVANIAKKVGVENCDEFISLEGISLKETALLAEKYTVFGRVTPEQKHVIIKTLKEKGNIVAMTGDGVNDTLALKEADCSIAMADGSEAARSVANLVLLDCKFSSLPKVVAEGRQVINNVQCSSSLFLMKTLFTIMLSIITLISTSLYPFAPAQVFMLESFIIGIPSFFLALQKNTNKIEGNFLVGVLKKSLPYSIILLLNVSVVLVFNKFNLLSLAELNTLSTLVLTSIGFLCLVKICYPFTKLKAICISIAFTLSLISSLIIPEFFYMTAFSGIVYKTLLFLISLTALALVAWTFIEVKMRKDKQSKTAAAIAAVTSEK